jgi:DNA-binding CsgD family transcriptional regulator
MARGTGLVGYNEWHAGQCHAGWPGEGGVVTRLSVNVNSFEGRSQDRLLRAIHHLLGLEVTDVERALSAAADRIAEVMEADKVDVFLLEEPIDTLVAFGTNASRMARQQRALNLDRLPSDRGSVCAHVFQTGHSHLSGQLDLEPLENIGIVGELGVRSQIAVPISVRGVRRGVLMVCSAARDYFSEDDLRFTEIVANWVGLIGYRAAVVEQAIAEAAREGLRVAAEASVEKLTPRQREVARLVAGGLTNMEIAERLVLTPGTVANHIEGILRRLGFRSRTQVAALFGSQDIEREEARRQDPV